MSRELKFRAWLKDFQMMCEVAHINFQKGTVGVFSENRLNVVYGYNLENVVLMQLTGLIDKEGEEIWEGDIVRFHVREGRKDEPAKFNETGEVEFSEFGYLAFGKWSSPFCYEIRKIGNIFENSDLLEAQ